MTTLHGRVALITGASRGIGRATARRLGREGASLILVGRRREALEPLRAELEAAGSNAWGLAFDLADGAEGLVDAALELAGSLDILINNAGAYETGPVLECSDASLRRHFEVNVFSPLALCQSAHAALRASAHPVIVNVLSTLAHRPVPGTAAYAASKAALLSLTRSLALEWAEDGIRVVGVSPGVVATELHDRALLQAMAPQHPLGRVGEPEEIAEAILFLLSDASAWTTGSVLAVDGGIGLI